MKLGVCSICQQQGIALAPRPATELALELELYGGEVASEERFILVSHKAYGNIDCEGAGSIPQAVYTK